MLHKFSFLLKFLLFVFVIQITAIQAQQKYSKRQIQKLKTAAIDLAQSHHKKTQVMIDKVFSFAELGHQEIETSKYLTGVLESAGFEVEYGILPVLFIIVGICYLILKNFKKENFLEIVILSMLLTQNLTNDLIYAPDVAIYFWLVPIFLLKRTLKN